MIYLAHAIRFASLLLHVPSMQSTRGFIESLFHRFISSMNKELSILTHRIRISHGCPKYIPTLEQSAKQKRSLKLIINDKTKLNSLKIVNLVVPIFMGK